MKNVKIIVLAVLLTALCVFSAVGQKKKSASKPPPVSNPLTEPQNPPAPLFQIETTPELQSLIGEAGTTTVNKFAAKGFGEQQLAITLIDMRDPNNLRQGEFRGNEKIYPASVVKMFYLAAAHRWLEDGKIKLTPELERGLRDMIIDSSNDATGYIVDVLSGVSSGAELPEAEFKTWAKKREAVQRYFDSLGYTNINIKQKTFCEDAYGREQQFRGKDGINRNKLSTNAVARLMAEIALGNSVTPARSKQMMDLMKRDPLKSNAEPNSQDAGFIGIALKQPGIKYWAKAGWTSTTRHDAAYVETADGQKFVLVVFTENASNEREIIPTVARAILDKIEQIK